MSRSRTYPLSVDQAFTGVLPLPLPQLFDRRYGPFGAVRAVDDEQDGPWGGPGRTRVVHLAGGGSMRERLVRVDRPAVFAYTLGDLTGPLTSIASHVDGEWRFEPAGTGVRITWRWTVHPASRAGAALLPTFARMWRGYATHGLQRIEDLLVA